MSPAKGFFESDSDYQERVTRESNERTIEDSTGSAPSKGYFESDQDYHDRISKEASESTIKDSTGFAPNKGFLESSADYQNRIATEANEQIVTDATGSAPTRRFFEDKAFYDTRIRKEVNESLVNKGSSSQPHKGIFESDYEYRRRIAHEARELRADGKHSKATAEKSSNISSTSDSFSHGSFQQARSYGGESKSTNASGINTNNNASSKVYCPRGRACPGSTAYAVTECYFDSTEKSQPLFLLQKATTNMGFWGTLALGGLAVYGEHLKEKAGHKETYEIYRCPKCKARVAYKRYIKGGVPELKMIGNDLPETSDREVEKIKSQETSSTGGKIVKTLGVFALGALVIGALATKDGETDKSGDK